MWFDLLIPFAVAEGVFCLLIKAEAATAMKDRQM